MFRTVLERQTIHTIAYSTDGTFRSYGAKPRDPVDCYKHCIPTGFFVRLIVLVRNKVLQTCYAKKHSNQVTSSGVALLLCYFTSMSPLVPVSTC